MSNTKINSRVKNFHVTLINCVTIIINNKAAVEKIVLKQGSNPIRSRPNWVKLDPVRPDHDLYMVGSIPNILLM